MAVSNVNTPSKEYEALSALWKLPRTLMGGTRAMRKAGRTYLPQEAAESDEAYTDRLNRTTLFNGFRKTVRDMTGKVFNKPIVLGKDVPAPIVDYAENIDFAGRHLNVFARDAFYDALPTGIGFILTEMPKKLTEGTGRNGEVTKADEQAANRRPYLVYIPVEDVIGWQTETINGVVTLKQVRIRESVKVNGQYTVETITQVRVLRPGSWEIHREVTDASASNKGDWIIFDEGETSLKKIPLAPVYINRTGFMTAEPPLEDLADTNVAHWQSQSDQRHILHVARVPILAMFGFANDDKIEIGSSRAVRTSNHEADMKYVEHNGAAISAGDQDIKNLEFQMQTQGLQLLIPQPGGKSATGEIHDDIKENSPLAMAARSLQDALEQSFGFMAEYMSAKVDGNKAGGSLVVNTDFGIAAGAAADVPNILTAMRDGSIDKETGLNELKRRGFLADSVDVEAVLSRLDTEKPPLDSNKPMNLDKPSTDDKADA